MTKKKFTYPTRIKSLYFQRMDSSKIQRQVISLGNLLVEELKRENEYPDTLSRWMAHYIAEQLTAAESTTAAERTAAQERCFQTILALWKHRSSMPSGHRPFESFEPILRALERLDPEASQPFYYHFKDPRESTLEPGSVRDLMEFVVNVDRVARILIDVALEQAIEKAADERTKALLNEAVSAESDVIVMRRLGAKLEVGRDADDDEETIIRKRLEDFVLKLDAFGAVSKSVREHLKERLANIANTSDPTSGNA